MKKIGDVLIGNVKQDTTLQIGGAAYAGAAIIGLAVEGGLSTSSRLDDGCAYAQFCGIGGPQLGATCSVSYSIGEGLPKTGVSQSHGLTVFGPSLSGQMTIPKDSKLDNLNGIQFSKGTTNLKLQLGTAAGAGYVDCTQATICWRR